MLYFIRSIVRFVNIHHAGLHVLKLQLSQSEGWKLVYTEKYYMVIYIMLRMRGIKSNK